MSDLISACIKKYLLFMLLPPLDPATTVAGNCSTGDVRLIGPTDQTAGTAEGRVEVCINNAWGTICSNSFTPEDVGTICVDLGGFNRSGELTSENMYKAVKMLNGFFEHFLFCPFHIDPPCSINSISCYTDGVCWIWPHLPGPAGLL